MDRFECSSEFINRLNSITKDCVECGKCMEKCSILNEAPKRIFNNIAEYKYSYIELPYSCSLCGLCKIVCPKSIDMSKFFLETRKEYAKIKEGKLNIKGFNTVKYHQKNSFSKIFTASSSSNSDKIARVFLPGCSLASYNPQLVLRTYKYIKSKYEDTGIILKCCGNPTHLIGQEDRFILYYNSLIGEIKKLGDVEVITACPSCYKTIAENTPEIRLKSIWELLLEIGLPVLDKFHSKEITAALHDPCPTREYENIHNYVREILNLLGLKIKEFTNSRKNTLCCGVGGMVGVTDADLAYKNIKRRASEVNSDILITYCASCVDAFRFAGKPSVHLLELIFNENISLDSKNFTASSGTAVKWLNRYKCSKSIKNEK